MSTAETSRTTVGASLDFTDRVALVTGGTRGIGLACAEAFAAAGAAVVVASRDERRCREVEATLVARGARALGVPCDVSRGADVERVFEAATRAFGGVDVLVGSAGTSAIARASDVSADELRRAMDLHFHGAVRVCQAAACSMRARGGGAIVLVGSIWGLGAQPATLPYGAAKAALLHAVKVLAVEWARDGIRVNGVAPGHVDTDMTKDLEPAVRDKLLARVPLRRMATPVEIAGPVLFLASELARYVTGHVLTVDGGERAR